MGVFANVYAGHQCIYGEKAYHGEGIEVVDFGKIFTLGIDRGMSREEKIRGERKATITAIDALSYEQAMQLFLEINRALYRRADCALSPSSMDPEMSSRLEKMGLQYLNELREMFKINNDTIIDLIKKDERPGKVAVIPGHCIRQCEIEGESGLIVEQYTVDSYNLKSRLSGASVDEVAMQLEKIDDVFERTLRK